MAGNCPMQFVLHGPEKFKGCFRVRIVIDRECVDVPNLLVEPLLGCPYIPDAFEQFIEVIRTNTASFPEPLVIQYESFDKVFAQPFSSPPAELRAPGGADTVTDGEDHVEIVIFDGALNRPGSFGLNCQVFLYGCGLREFSICPEIAIHAGTLKCPGISVPDAIIAATALSVGASVVTNDPHFSEMGVDVSG